MPERIKPRDQLEHRARSSDHVDADDSRLLLVTALDVFFRALPRIFFRRGPFQAFGMDLLGCIDTPGKKAGSSWDDKVHGGVDLIDRSVFVSYSANSDIDERLQLRCYEAVKDCPAFGTVDTACKNIAAGKCNHCIAVNNIRRDGCDLRAEPKCVNGSFGDVDFKRAFARIDRVRV